MEMIADLRTSRSGRFVTLLIFLMTMKWMMFDLVDDDFEDDHLARFVIVFHMFDDDDDRGSEDLSLWQV